MEIQIEDLARKEILGIYYFYCFFSRRKAIETVRSIHSNIHRLKVFSYTGRQIPEMSDSRFREILYKKSRHSVYRIMYFISEKNKKIYVFNIINSKQNFTNILKSNNYFNFYCNL